MGANASVVLADPDPAKSSEKHERLKRSGVLNELDIAKLFEGYDWDLFSPGLRFVGPRSVEQDPDQELINRVQADVRLVLTANKIGQEIVSKRIAMVEEDGKLQDEELNNEDEYDDFKRDIEPDIKAAREQYMAAKKKVSEQIRREDITTEEVEAFSAVHHKWRDEFEGLTKDLEDAGNKLAATKERIRKERAQLKADYEAFVQMAEEIEQKFKAEGGVAFRCPNCGIVRMPDTFGYLTNIQQLELQGNDITYVPPSFGNLTALNYLDFSCNRLREIPASFGNLTKLTVLYLQDNRIYSVPTSIGRLSNLESFHIHGNPLSDNEPNAPRGVDTDGLELRDYFEEVYAKETEAGDFEDKLLEVSAMRALLPAASFRAVSGGGGAGSRKAEAAKLAVEKHRIPDGQVQRMSYRERTKYYTEQKELEAVAEAETEAATANLAAEFAADPNPELVRTFYANQHRLESITRDGAALLNPRLMWCGWTQRLVRMGALRGHHSLDEAAVHWRGNNPASAQSARLPYLESGGPARAASMIMETMDREDLQRPGERVPPAREFDFPNSRAHCDSLFDDYLEHEKLLKQNTDLECDLAGYMTSVEALRNGKLGKAIKRMFKNNPPDIQDLIMGQSTEAIHLCCPTCREFDGPYPAWRNGDEVLGQHDWMTREDSAAEEVHVRLHRALNAL
jgi:hypothetical protein